MRTIPLLLFLALTWADAQAALPLKSEGDNPGLAQGLGAWTSFADNFSSIRPVGRFYETGEGHDSPTCPRLDYELKSGAPYPYAGFTASFPVTDLSAYAGVRFWARGLGAWACQLPTTATAAQYNHYSSPLAVSEDWTYFELPFSSFAQTWGAPAPWTPQAIQGVGWEVAGNAGAKGFLCVDGVEFYKSAEAKTQQPPANVILPQPKVNQEGFLGTQEKYFTLSKVTAQPGDPFLILDGAGQKVFQGRLPEPMNDAASSGETVFRADFSPLTLTGNYRVSVGGEISFPFSVGPNPYGPLARDALRCFSLIRCGTAIDDPATGLKHAACHLQDATLRDNPSQKGDFVGGWHNAGDFGKWTPMAAISCAWMLWLSELNPSGEGADPALLAEARWGLDWLLKMQRPDGSVWHKVDTEPNFCFGTAPEKDPYPRFVAGAGSLDAADFCAVMAQASRVFAALDPSYAAKCLSAAQKAWGWLLKNPKVLFHDPYYDDPDPSQEELWALGEMARATKDPALRRRFADHATGEEFASLSWMTPQFFGYLTEAEDPEADPSARQALVQILTDFCSSLADLSDQNGYGVFLKPGEYYWESHENLLDKTGEMLCAWRLSGQSRFKDKAFRQMNYLLGDNSLNLSFVPGHGTRFVSHPHHWAYAAYGILLPGWVAAGPNQFLTGADPLLKALIQRGTPPAKCFVDTGVGTSWASDEPETAEEAAFLFDCGMLAGGPP